MKNIKLIIEYDGTNYSGWQKQNDVRTIQGVLQRATEKLTKEKIKIIGSGRTDGKVHAIGQVANFRTNFNIPGRGYKHALKLLLPDDITIRESEEVNLEFHSRFDAVKKRYRYVVYNSKMPRPILRNYSCHIPYKIDLNEMILASQYLIGTHDFEAFKSTRSEVYSTIRTIYSIDIEKKGDIIEFVIEGSSFLRNMVRIIVGTLLHIGIGKMKKEDIKKIISSKKRINAGPTAPAQGLYLERVYYSYNSS